LAAATARPWWERRGVAALLALACAIPLVWPAIPPLTDAPSHLARYHIALDRPAALAAAFGYHWSLIGNLGVDLAVVPLAPLLGVERAGKLVILLIPVLAAGGMLAAARAAHGRVPPTALFALPLVLGWPLQLGFVNFCLGMALAFWLLAGWIALADRPRLRAALAVPASWLVWVAHAFTWGLAGLMAFGAEVALRRSRGQPWPRAIAWAALHALALATPVLAMLGTDATAAASSSGFSWASKLASLTTALRDHWLPLDLASLLLLLAVLIFAATHRGLRFSAVLGVPALLVGAAFLATPGVLFGAAFADTRIAPYAVALALLSIRPSADASLAKTLSIVAAGFVAIRVAAATASLLLASAVFERELAALPHIPRGAAVFAAVRHECTGDWDDRRYDHLPSVAILRRDAFTNDQWVMPGQQLLTIRPTGAAPWDRDPSQLVSDHVCSAAATDLFTVVRTIPRRRYDYLWTIGFPPGRVAYPDFVPVWRSDRSALYRVVRPAEPAAR
jgi:hypothetical protein